MRPIDVRDLIARASNAGGRFGSIRRRGRSTRPRCPHLDPLGQSLNLPLRQLPLGRHLRPSVSDRGDQRTLLGFAGHDGWAGITTGKGRGPGIEPESRLSLFLAVATLAMLDQDRPDLRLEELDLLGRKRFLVEGLAGTGGSKDQERKQNDKGREGSRHRGTVEYEEGGRARRLSRILAGEFILPGGVLGMPQNIFRFDRRLTQEVEPLVSTVP